MSDLATLASHARYLGLDAEADLVLSDLSAFPISAEMVELIQQANETKCRQAIMAALSDRCHSIDVLALRGTTLIEQGKFAALKVAHHLGFERAKLFDKGARARRVYLNTRFHVGKRMALQTGVASGSYSTGDYVALDGLSSKSVPRDVINAVDGAYKAAISLGVNNQRDASLPVWWRDYIEPYRA